VLVEVVATKSSLAFYTKEDAGLAGGRVWTDEDEWTVNPFPFGMNCTTLYQNQGNYKVGDPILHIELRRWADIVLVAPCSANMLAKIAHGLCDNLAVSSNFHRLKYAGANSFNRHPSCGPYHPQRQHIFSLP
jgi:phosphopantothenoylcysteine decarboxylase